MIRQSKSRCHPKTTQQTTVSMNLTVDEPQTVHTAEHQRAASS
jgi:hypothetical protein